MANPVPGDPKLVSQIVNHLKSQGLFDQFRRDCLADVDTKPAYQNLRQRVDNFVASHLASHTWSPHLNKNQLRNNIRQQVLKSGMLESGIDRIISQVVDPKINHLFRPQVEKVVKEYLAMKNNKEDGNVNTEQNEERLETSISVPGSLPAVGPSTNVASDAMSILETISSLNQEATSARSLVDTTNHKNSDKGAKRTIQQSVDVTAEKDCTSEETPELEKSVPDMLVAETELDIKTEDSIDISSTVEALKLPDTAGVSQSKDVPNISEEPKPKAVESEKKNEVSETEKKEEKKEAKTEKRKEFPKKGDDAVKEERTAKENELDKSSCKQKATSTLKEENLSVDSDIDDYTDVTVSSVHTSDLSSFEEESEEDAVVSDSTEEGEITSDDEEDKVDDKNIAKPETEQNEVKTKSSRPLYVHKPYLYYSDSDDELSVEQRRLSVAMEKEERLLKRRMKREKLEEKRKQKAAEKTKHSKISQGKAGASKHIKAKSTSIKEVLKEQMFLEKKVARSKKKIRESRNEKNTLKPKCDLLEDDMKDFMKNESHDKPLLAKEAKSNIGWSEKPFKVMAESAEECKTDIRIEKEYKKKTPLEKNETNVEEPQRQESAHKTEKIVKKDGHDCESPSMKVEQKKERSSSKDDKSSSKYRSKTDNIHKTKDDSDPQKFKKNSKDDDTLHKRSQSKSSSEERSDRKSKHKHESKSSSYSKEEKISATENISKTGESVLRESKRERCQSEEKSRSEHKYKRSLSDSRTHRDSQNDSRQHSSNSQKKSKLSSDDKSESDIARTNYAKQEESTNRDKRSYSCSEERVSSKAKSKSSSKLSKLGDQEEPAQKNGNEEAKDAVTAQTSSTVSKDASSKSKHSGDKEKVKSRSDNREHSTSKLDKKHVGENTKSTSSKHSHKDSKRKGESSKSDKIGSRSTDEKRAQERSSLDRKSSKKTTMEFKGESSKSGMPSKNGSKLESDGCDNAGRKRKLSSCSYDTKDILAITNEELSCESVKTGGKERESKSAETVAASEALVELSNFCLNVDATSTESEYGKENRLMQTSNVRDLNAASAFSNNSSGEHREHDTRQYSETAAAAATTVDSGRCLERSHVSNAESTSISHVVDLHHESGGEHFGLEQTSPMPESHVNINSRISPLDVSSEITEANNVISTTAVCDTHVNQDAFKIEHVGSNCDALVVDNIVTGNDVEDHMQMAIDKDLAENNSESTFGTCMISCTESSAESTIVQTSSERNSDASFSTRAQDRKTSECEDTATSSCSTIEHTENVFLRGTIIYTNSSSENAATSTNIQLDNVMATNSSDNAVGAGNNGECTATTSAEFGNLSEADVTMFSENSFEVATTSSTRVVCSPEKSMESAATSSQGEICVVPKVEAICDIILKPATSSDGNMSSSAGTPINAATSSNNQESYTENSDFSEVIENSSRHAASSSVSIEENDDRLLSSENILTHAATFSDHAAKNKAAHLVSDNDSTNAATSSYNDLGRDSLSIPENVRMLAATSSDNVEVHDDCFVVSKKGGLVAATSSDIGVPHSNPNGFSDGIGIFTHASTSSDVHVDNKVLRGSDIFLVNAATSSDSTGENYGVPQGSENVHEHAATSSDICVDNGNTLEGSENVHEHAATSSNISVDNSGSLQTSENVLANAATSSDSLAENVVLGVSENVLSAASSSSTIDSSRVLHLEGSRISSEIGNENIAASSSNIMESSLADASGVWLQHPNGDNTASSSSYLDRDSKFQHQTTQLGSAEESKNARATSTTQKDVAVNDRCSNIISSGTHVVNSADMDRSQMDGGNAASCSSSGTEQGYKDHKHTDHPRENTASSSCAFDNGIEDICVDPEIPSQNGSDEAASSSSSLNSSSSVQHLVHKASLSPNNANIAESSSVAMNSSSDGLNFSVRCPGNSTDDAATSSSNITVRGADYVIGNNTQATTSSNISMDSSTGEDIELDTEKASTLTSSSTLLNNENRAQALETEKDSVTASSSTAIENCTNANEETTGSSDKVSGNAATSSNLTYSSNEKNTSCNAISDINTATTSTAIEERFTADERTENLNICCDINSEATAASSSNATESSSDSGGGNATSSDCVMDCSLEGENVSQTTHQDKNEEAASSSSLSTNMRLQEIQTETVGSQNLEDATTSSSTERANTSFVYSSNTSECNGRFHNVEAAVESSLTSRSDIDASGTPGETMALLPSAMNAAMHPELDHVNLDYERANEKEDAVSSASSQEHKIPSNGCRQIEMLTRDGEVDGAVTSGGAEVSESSMVSENSETFGLVTFAKAGVIVDDGNVLHVPVEEAPVSNRTDASDESLVIEDTENNPSFESGNCETASIGDTNEAEPPNRQLSLEEGEGAVTSTGITEESDRAKVRQDIRKSDSSCTGAEIEPGGHAMSRQEVTDSNAIIEDDESAITSTGAKEEEEEGEGFVTSTGTASEDSSLSASDENSNCAQTFNSNSKTRHTAVRCEHESEWKRNHELTEEMTLSVIIANPAGSAQSMAGVSTEQSDLHTADQNASALTTDSTSIPAKNPLLDQLENSSAEMEMGTSPHTEVIFGGERSVSIQPAADDLTTALNVQGQNLLEMNEEDPSTSAGESGSVSMAFHLQDKSAIHDQNDPNLYTSSKQVPSNDEQTVADHTDPNPTVKNKDSPLASESVPSNTAAADGLSNEHGHSFAEHDSVNSEVVEETECSKVPGDGSVVFADEPAAVSETGVLQNEQKEISCDAKEECLETTSGDAVLETKGQVDEDLAETKNYLNLTNGQEEEVEIPTIQQPKTGRSERDPELGQPLESSDLGKGQSFGEATESNTSEEPQSTKQKNLETIKDVDAPKESATCETSGPEAREEPCLEESTPKVKKPSGHKSLENLKESLPKDNNTEEIPEEAKPPVETEKRKRGRPPKKLNLPPVPDTESLLKESSEEGKTSNACHRQEESVHIKKDVHTLEKAEHCPKHSDERPEEKSVETVHRRGRKPKRSLSSSESEPEKKRKKSVSEEEEQENAEHTDDNEDDPKGATTRAASRLEAERNLPHKPTTRAASKLRSPEPSSRKKRKDKNPAESKSLKNTHTRMKTQSSGTKRRREPSPPPAKSRGQQTSEEITPKRTKRQ
ncbi:biorientation of chromosomes in cell division protein 1-like 1 isoform X1 [Xenopus laevis]|uniref:Biorientation of chromosomes in cell division protein 1-like 1 isoform X1 n=1 Tax=Xenopus laevis TaxID=8355 RepID=A0A8J1MR77_XENLA|nr:biorientation of chromosomes in cell division protein 1-like 1 isoform X1 [Xenopus laevis]